MLPKIKQRSKTKSKGPRRLERESKARMEERPYDKRASSPVGLRISMIYLPLAYITS